MKFLAFDLGATSGRAIIGTVENDKLTSEEVYRFPNAVKEIDGNITGTSIPSSTTSKRL